MDRIIKKSKVRGGGVNTVLVNKNKKTVTLNKVNKNNEPIKGVKFSVFYYEKDAKENKNVIKSKKTDSNGRRTFTLPDYYGVFIKETETPKSYKISDEIIHVYKDNGVRFIGEKKVSDFKIAEAKEGQDLNKYLQSLIENDTNINIYGDGMGPKDFNDQIDRLVFNDNGIEKLIPKKSLKHTISWDNIKAAGLVDGKKTVTIDRKTYKIRLMDESNTQKDSEWDRMMLPLVGIDGKERNKSSAFGRFNIDSFEEYMKNMPILANYTWWRDFGGYSLGSSCWTQKTRSYMGPLEATFRGDRSSMAYSHYYHTGSFNSMYNVYYFGWLPVLEEVK